MGFADLHIHTVHSYDGTASVPAVLKHVVEQTKLDVIAITDHDTMSGVPEAMDLGPVYGIDVIPGCEVSTSEGHLLALFIDRAPLAGRTLVDTALMVADMGGICIAAHPTAKGMSSLSFQQIQKALKVPGVAKSLVGIEAINGGLVFTWHNLEVQENARLLPLAQVGNSDAHVLTTIGYGRTEFKGRTARDLRCALESHDVIPYQMAGLNGIGILGAYLPVYLLRKLGWTEWNARPDQPMKMVRLSSALTGQTA